MGKDSYKGWLMQNDEGRFKKKTLSRKSGQYPTKFVPRLRMITHINKEL